MKKVIEKLTAKLDNSFNSHLHPRIKVGDYLENFGMELKIASRKSMPALPFKFGISIELFFTEHSVILVFTFFPARTIIIKSEIGTR